MWRGCAEDITYVGSGARRCARQVLDRLPFLSRSFRWSVWPKRWNSSFRPKSQRRRDDLESRYARKMGRRKVLIAFIDNCH